MPSVIEQAVALLIEKSISAVESATTFLKAEIPDVVHQLLLYNLVKSVTLVAMILILQIVCGCIAYKCEKRYLQSRGYRDGFYWFLYIVLLICTLPFLVLNILESLQIWLAPKVWLIEYAASLFKGH